MESSLFIPGRFAPINQGWLISKVSRRHATAVLGGSRTPICHSFMFGILQISTESFTESSITSSSIIQDVTLSPDRFEANSLLPRGLLRQQRPFLRLYKPRPRYLRPNLCQQFDVIFTESPNQSNIHPTHSLHPSDASIVKTTYLQVLYMHSPPSDLSNHPLSFRLKPSLGLDHSLPYPVNYFPQLLRHPDCHPSITL